MAPFAQQKPASEADAVAADRPRTVRRVPAGNKIHPTGKKQPEIPCFPKTPVLAIVASSSIVFRGPIPRALALRPIFPNHPAPPSPPARLYERVLFLFLRN